MVPSIVALGTVFSGFSTFPAGIEALSTPRNAYRLIAAALEIAAQLDSPVKLNDGKLFKSKKVF